MEEVVQQQQEAPQVSEREAIEQEAINRYRESKKTVEERAEGMPEGYNEDGTPQEELIGGKFKSQEDLLKAYTELEKKLGQPKEEPKKETPAEETTAPAATFEAFSKEYAETGELSEASYSALEKMGFSKGDVDRYIAGQQAYATKFTSDVYNVVGGQEKYTEVVTWAADNIDRRVIDDYNTALQNLDTVNAQRHLEYMMMKMQQSTPKTARRLEGDSGGQGVQPYSSKVEWQTAMSNRLYGKDAKYTKMVDTRYLAARRKGII